MKKYTADGSRLGALVLLCAAYGVINWQQEEC